MIISISDKAKAISALQNEIDLLNAKSAELSSCSMEYVKKMKELSKQHEQIINNIVALDEAICKILSSV